MPPVPADDQCRAALPCAAAVINVSCPVYCLRPVLSARAFHFLARAARAPFDPPQTAGDVVELCVQGRLGEIWGLGPSLIAEIGASLVYAGLRCDHAHPVHGVTELLTTHADTVLAACGDAIEHRRRAARCRACQGGAPCPGHHADHAQAEQYRLLAEAVQRQIAAIAAHGAGHAARSRRG